MLNLDYLLGKDILTPPQEREFRRLFSYSFHRLENNAGIAIKYIYKKNPQQKEMTLLLNKNQSLTASKKSNIQEDSFFYYTKLCQKFNKG